MADADLDPALLELMIDGPAPSTPAKAAAKAAKAEPAPLAPTAAYGWKDEPEAAQEELWEEPEPVSTAAAGTMQEELGADAPDIPHTRPEAKRRGRPPKPPAEPAEPKAPKPKGRPSNAAKAAAAAAAKAGEPAQSTEPEPKPVSIAPYLDELTQAAADAPKRVREAHVIVDRPATNNPLGAFAKRIVSLEGEKREVAEMIKEVYSEAKASGINPKILKVAIYKAGQDAALRNADQEMLDAYLEQILAAL